MGSLMGMMSGIQPFLPPVPSSVAFTGGLNHERPYPALPATAPVEKVLHDPDPLRGVSQLRVFV